MRHLFTVLAVLTGFIPSLLRVETARAQEPRDRPVRDERPATGGWESYSTGRLREMMRLQMARGEDRDAIAISRLILERDPSLGTPIFLSEVARAAERLWLGARSDPDLAIQLLASWERVRSGHPDDMVAMVGEARVWAYLGEHPDALASDEAMHRLETLLGGDHEFLRAFAAVRANLPSAGAEFRRTIEWEMDRAASLGFPVVASVRSYPEFAALADDPALQAWFIRPRGGEGTIPMVARDPFHRMDATPPPPPPPPLLPPDLENLVRRIERRLGDPGATDDLRALGASLGDAVERLADTEFNVILHRLEGLRGHPEVDQDALYEVVLVPCVRRSNVLLGVARRAADEWRIDDGCEAADALLALTQEMKEWDGALTAPALDAETATQGVRRTLAAEARIQGILDRVEVSGIIETPEEDLVIINGQGYRTGEELRDASGTPYPGFVIQAVDGLGRVHFAYQELTVTVGLRQPEWWRRHLEEHRTPPVTRG